MLENLKEVNWTKNLGAYHLGNELPKLIENLLSNELEIRQKAQAKVREEITHQYSVYPATPIVVPFLIEILKDADYPDTYWVLDLLDALLMNCAFPLGFRYKSIGNEYLLRCFETYKQITMGYDLYKDYLRHPVAEVRYSAVNILAKISDRHTTTRSEFRRILCEENDPVVISAILLHMPDMLPHGYIPRILKLKEYYSEFIANFMSDEQDEMIRLIAVQSWHKVQKSIPRFDSKSIPDRVYEIYFKALTNPINLTHLTEYMRYSDFYLEEFVQPYFLFERIAFLDTERVTQRLCSSDLSIEYVHYLARELVERAFNRRSLIVNTREYVSYRRWKDFDGWLDSIHSSPFSKVYPNVLSANQNKTPQESDTIEYKIPDTRLTYFSGKELDKRQKQVIRAIVNCEAFWHIKSNLFSFSYGLPDDREQLRQLLD